jgi:hypothetical protein
VFAVGCRVGWGTEWSGWRGGRGGGGCSVSMHSLTATMPNSTPPPPPSLYVGRQWWPWGSPTYASMSSETSVLRRPPVFTVFLRLLNLFSHTSGAPRFVLYNTTPFRVTLSYFVCFGVKGKGSISLKPLNPKFFTTGPLYYLGAFYFGWIFRSALGPPPLRSNRMRFFFFENRYP